MTDLDKVKLNIDKELETVVDKELEKQKLEKVKLKKQKPIINDTYVEMKFHNDYRDVITAFNNVAPSQRQIFNIGNLEVNSMPVNKQEIKYIIIDFINELNNSIIYDVEDTRNEASGWDELIPEKTVKSGWDTQLEKLDLPSSLYKKPAQRQPVKLIKIHKVEKQQTSKEIKYTVDLILQKPDAEDQMLITVSFVKDNSAFDIGNNVIIEEIHVDGFFITNSMNLEPVSTSDEYYNYDDLELNDIVDKKTIIKELRKKNKEKKRELDLFTKNLDREVREFRHGLNY